MFSKIIKGEFNYINNKRKRIIILTLFYFLIAIGIIIIGYVTTGTKKNLLTVVGILGCLPACKSAVNMIMFILAKGCSFDAYKALNEKVSFKDVIYDLYFTSYDKNYSLAALVVNNKRILAYTEDEKMDIDKCIDHLQMMLKNAGHTNVTINVQKKLDVFINMLNNINDDIEVNIDNKKKDEDILLSLYEISL